MNAILRSLENLVAEGMKQHLAEKKHLDEMIAEGCRQHQQHRAQFEAMTGKALAEITERERKLEAMRKLVDLPDHVDRLLADHEIKFRADQEQKQQELKDFSESDLLAIYGGARAMHEHQMLLEWRDEYSDSVRTFMDVQFGLKIREVFEAVSEEIVARVNAMDDAGKKPSRRMCHSAAEHHLRWERNAQAADLLMLACD